jgi:hypothetical protein
VKPEEVILAVCLALSPAPSREIRKEQWEADLRDCTDLGISRPSLLAGALHSSASARLHDTVQRGCTMLTYTGRGKTMRIAMGTLGVALTIAGSAIVGIHTAMPEATDNTQASVTTSGNTERDPSISSEPNPESPRQNTVTVDTANDNVLAAFKRARDTGRQVRLVSDQRYSVVVDPAMPMDSVTIIDVKSGDILDSFPMTTHASLAR